MSFKISMALAFAALAAGCGTSGGSSGTPDMATAASPDLAMAAAPSCADYCTAIMANCTGDMNQQYTTLDNCMASCKAMPVGATTDTSGNTLGCRLYHAMAAKADPMTHCPHAGPGGAGMCGTNCEGYCQIAEMYCTGANQIYTDAADCARTCARFSDSVRYSIAQMTGGSTACLLYHSQEASTNPPDHCLGDLEKGDGGIQSVTCM
jgi:hypothetical protein